MKKAVTAIFGVLVGLFIISLLLFGRSERQAYRAAKGMVKQRVEVSQERIDTAVELATKSVDVALVMAGNLPSQQAEAELIKQDIEEIGVRLKEASEVKGDLAVAKLDASIEVFNRALDRIDNAAKNADNPQVKSALDRMYGVLVSTKEQLAQFIVNVSD